MTKQYRVPAEDSRVIVRTPWGEAGAVGWPGIDSDSQIIRRLAQASGWSDIQTETVASALRLIETIRFPV